MSKSFTIDARLILQLGRDSIKDHTTALIELVKNSYDADATKVEVEIYSQKTKDLIRVADNGFGMTDKEIENNWLRIGYSDKKISKYSQRNRRKTGEKGIGRIATDRIGSNLTMVTKSKKDVLHGIKLNWDDFDVEKKEIGQIHIYEIDNPKISIPKDLNNPSSTGTEIIISGLRQEWSKEDIEKVYNELTFFTPLLSIDKEFKIVINNDIDPTYSKEVKSAIFETAEIELNLFYDGKNDLVYEFNNKLIKKKNRTETFNVEKFITRFEFKSLDCGPVILKLLFFPRKSSMLEGTSFKLKDLRDFLDENSGVKIYRDNIAVKPYGFQNSDFGHDWLGLASRKAKDPAGIGRASYKITPNQLIGQIFITRDENPKLKDSAGREGLVENEAFNDLRNIIIGSIKLLETYRVEIYNSLAQKNDNSKTPSAQEQINNIALKLNTVVTDLKKIKEYISLQKDYKGASVSSSIDKIEEVITKTQKTFDELLEEKRVLNALATLGISAAVFGHETESAISTFKLSARNARDYLNIKNPNIKFALEELEIAIKNAKLIAGWGVFALARVEKEKRNKLLRKINKILNETFKQIKSAFDAQNIEIEKKFEDIMAYVYPMDIESIFLNLITNSFTAVKNTNRKRIIRIELGSEDKNNIDGFYLIISDSGPGIAKEFIDRIWDPLFTTKIGKNDVRSGTGLGLTIVKSIVEELNGDINLKKDDVLKGANFKIWLPKK